MSIYDDPDGRHHRPNIGGSERGAHDVSKRAVPQKMRLLQAYAQLGELTGAEAAGISYSSAYWMRCSELRAQGLIEEVLDETGATVLREGPMGSPQTVCRITADGLQAVRSMKEPHADRPRSLVPVPAVPAPTPHIHVWTWSNDTDEYSERCRQCGAGRNPEDRPW